MSYWAVYVEWLLRARAMCPGMGPEYGEEGVTLVAAFKQGILLTLLDYGADPNPPGMGEYTLEPWECILVLVFDMHHPELADCANSVARVFDIMLSAANLDSLCPCRVEKSRWSNNGVACRNLHLGSYFETETRSTSAWRYICKSLEDLNARHGNHGGQLLKQRYLWLLAGMIRIYIAKAYPSIPQLGDIVPHLEVFPPDVRNSILDAIGTRPTLVEGMEMLSISRRGTPGPPSATGQSPISLAQVTSSQPMLQLAPSFPVSVSGNTQPCPTSTELGARAIRR